MGNTYKNVVTLPSEAPDEDLAFLKDVFPKAEVEESSILLLGEHILAFSRKASDSTVALAINTDDAAYKSLIKDESKVLKIGNETCWRLQLPGGTQLLFVQSKLLDSKSFRGQLVDYINESPPKEQTIQVLGSPRNTQPATLESTMLVQDRSSGEQEEVPLSLNTQSPIPFETDLFQGEVLFLVKPSKPEEDPFWHDRMFSKKKRRIFVQLQGKFKRKPVGTVYAGSEVSDPMKLGLVTKGICSILLKLVESFNSNVHYSYGDAKEFAHIVVPAYTFFENIVATPPGQEAPAMGDSFGESKESKAARKAGKGFGEWNTEDTYSLEFYSMYIDLAMWKLVNLPVSRDIGLGSFWGNSFLRIVMYEAPPVDTKGKQRHLKDALKRHFTFKIKFNEDSLNRFNDSDSDDMLHWGEKENDTNSSLETTVKPVEAESPDESVFFDAQQDLLSSVSKEDTKKSLLAMIDALCPMNIEVVTNRGYTSFFLLTAEEFCGLIPTSQCTDLVKKNPWATHLVKSLFSARLSQIEALRRAIALIGAKAGVFQLTALAKKVEILSGKKSSEQAMEQYHVLRATSDRQWIECILLINGKEIRFVHPEKRKPQMRLSFSTILNSEALDSVVVLPGHSMLSIQTLGRTTYVLFATNDERNRVGKKIRAQCKEQQNKSSSKHLFLQDSGNPVDEFMHKSSMWSSKSPRILNCAQLVFHADESVECERFVAECLRSALSLSRDSWANLESTSKFLRKVAELKKCTVQGLSEDVKLAISVNLYHIMIIHAYLVLGPPVSSLQWLGYFNSFRYQFDDDVFSPTELEHRIIRARMTNPAQFFSRFAIPQTDFPGSLQVMRDPDYRIMFAINCGSMSNPSSIQILNSVDLDNQLERACRMYLQQTSVKIDAVNEAATIFLPRFCQWFAGDFGSDEEQLLKKIMRFLPPSVAACKTIKVKYMAFNFQCRILELYEDGDNVTS